MKTKFFCSAKGTFKSIAFEFFETEILSPVKGASLTSKFSCSIILQSAEILSPASKIIISPGTKSCEEISL